MQNVVCWQPDAVRQVINPFAEHMPDGLFRAVHTDWSLEVSPPVGKSFQEITEAAWTEFAPSAFLENFLDRNRPHALAAILGETGSGKSHLVHWMRLNIKPSADRMVLVVPKSGTSLRGIVGMIIAQLPPDQQRPFLDALQAAGDGTQSRDGQKQQLLNDIAQVIRDDLVAEDADEVEQELVRLLPNLFQDPYIRSAHFLGDGTVIAEIVDHIFASSNSADRPDTRRSFCDEDLQLGGLDFAHASKQARDAIQVIDLDPGQYVPLAVQIVNRNLDRAVARTLSFSSDRVEELMAQLRTYLKGQGRELVLLVEEFARLQGIDRALLQAITSHGDDRQCRMRSAIAVTKGFFGSVAETAYMRTTHIVDMDRSAGRAHGRKVTPASLNNFVARYLNAARLGRDAIERWNETASPGERPPSKCENCPHEGTCHAVFGAVDGMGLYPFSETALWNATNRADAGMPDRLNPRVVQNDLLVEVLDNEADSIRAGSFPSFRLLEKLKGLKTLPLAAQTRLQRLNPQVYQRWEAFLELYDGSGEVRNLDARLRAALSIPDIPDAEVGVAALPPADRPATPATEASVTVSREEIAIQEWINGGAIDGALSNTLRPLIFEALIDAIDWDMLGLSRADFAGQSGKPLRQVSISFERQTTQPASYLQIQLTIPGELAPPAQVGLALQGLLRASKQGFRWDFGGADVMFAAFLDCVEAWKRNIEAQLLQFCAPTTNWNAAAAALELLCVGAAIGGKLKSDATFGDVLEGAFASWPEDCASRSSEMRELYDKLRKANEKLTRSVKAQLSSLKGGRAGAMLDPGRVLKIVRDLRRHHWQLRLEPLADDADEIAKLYRTVKEVLAQAAGAEIQMRRDWLQQMEDAFGVDLSRAALLKTFRELGSASADAGIGSNNTAKPLNDVLEMFSKVQFDDSVSAARALDAVSDPLSVLPLLGRGRRNAVDAGTALAEAAQRFMNALEQNLTTPGAAFAGEATVADQLARIDGSLSTIESELLALAKVSGGQSDAD